MKIAVLSGWIDGEREVSLKSGTFVADTLRQTDHEIDEWILPDQVDTFLKEYRSYDLSFPMFHGAYGEDGTVFGLLEGLQIPHTHSSPGVHALCFDKHKTNALVSHLWVAVASSFLVRPWEVLKDDVLQDQLSDKQFFVKPNTSGSSLGAYKVSDPKQLNGYIQKSQSDAPGDTLVEEYIDGEEYSVVLIGNDELETTPIMKVRLDTAEFFDFDIKYHDKGGMETFPDDIPDSLHRLLTDQAKMVYRYLGCQTLARVDFIVSNGVPYFLEINTVPGFTEVSIIPRGWRMMGRTDQELFEKIIELSK